VLVNGFKTAPFPSRRGFPHGRPHPGGWGDLDQAVEIFCII
jgi:hypothetical protein